jgi:uncharacterized protein
MSSLDEILASCSEVLFPADLGRKVVHVHSTDSDGDTPLHVIVRRGDAHAARILIAAGADVNAVGDMGETPLHLAVRMGLEPIVAALLQAGADPDLRSEFGVTPRERAASKGAGLAKAFRATRVQLTLFVPEPDAIAIEAVRRVLDPVQHGLIAAHVTLCREDELDHVHELLERLRESPPPALDLTFGRAEASEGHGILLPCIGGAADYQSLRAAVLGHRAVRAASAHITLAHPRNPRAPGNDIATALRLPSPLRIRFDTVALIEQRDGSAWRTRWSVPLRPTG